MDVCKIKTANTPPTDMEKQVENRQTKNKPSTHLSASESLILLCFLNPRNENGQKSLYQSRNGFIVYTTIREGAQNGNNSLDNARRCVELAALLSLVRGELCDAIFVGASEEILRILRALHVHIGKEIDNLPEYALIEVGACVIFRQYIFEIFVVCFDGTHRFVDDRANLRCMCLGGNVLPTCIFGDEKDILRLIGVPIVLETIALGYELTISLLKYTGDITEENQSNDQGTG